MSAEKTVVWSRNLRKKADFIFYLVFYFIIIIFLDDAYSLLMGGIILFWSFANITEVNLFVFCFIKGGGDLVLSFSPSSVTCAGWNLFAMSIR